MGLTINQVALGALSLVACSCTVSARPAWSEWFGIRLGMTNAGHGPDRATTPPPWDIATVGTDAQGNSDQLTFVEIGVESMSDQPPGYVGKRVKAIEGMRTDGKGIEHYVRDRLGPPSALRNGDKQKHERTLEWDWRARKDAFLRSASLYLSDDLIALTINDPAVLTDDMAAPPPVVVRQ